MSIKVTLKINQLVLSVFCLALISGCNNAVDGKVTGGGTIASASGNGKANFGFNGDSCSGTVKGKFNFHDKYFLAENGGVKMNGSVTSADLCVTSGTGQAINHYCGLCADGYIVNLDYRSTNPKIEGEGQAVVCAKDNGQGFKATESDTIWIRAISGPYADYYSEGSVQGNIKGHACE